MYINGPQIIRLPKFSLQWYLLPGKKTVKSSLSLQFKSWHHLNYAAWKVTVIYLDNFPDSNYFYEKTN